MQFSHGERGNIFHYNAIASIDFVAPFFCVCELRDSALDLAIHSRKATFDSEINNPHYLRPIFCQLTAITRKLKK